MNIIEKLVTYSKTVARAELEFLAGLLGNPYADETKPEWRRIRKWAYHPVTVFLLLIPLPLTLCYSWQRHATYVTNLYRARKSPGYTGSWSGSPIIMSRWLTIAPNLYVPILIAAMIVVGMTLRRYSRAASRSDFRVTPMRPARLLGIVARPWCVMLFTWVAWVYCINAVAYMQFNPDEEWALSWSMVAWDLENSGIQYLKAPMVCILVAMGIVPAVFMATRKWCPPGARAVALLYLASFAWYCLDVAQALVDLTLFPWPGALPWVLGAAFHPIYLRALDATS